MLILTTSRDIRKLSGIIMINRIEERLKTIMMLWNDANNLKE